MNVYSFTVFIPCKDQGITIALGLLVLWVGYHWTVMATVPHTVRKQNSFDYWVVFVPLLAGKRASIRCQDWRLWWVEAMTKAWNIHRLQEGKYAMSNRYKFISTNKRIYRITDHWHQGVAATVAWLSNQDWSCLFHSHIQGEWRKTVWWGHRLSLSLWVWNVPGSQDGRSFWKLLSVCIWNQGWAFVL